MSYNSVSNILYKIKEAGVVGAGGAGFPTHVKLDNKAEIVLANGAECEPLLRVDRRIMENFPEKVVAGLKTVMEISGAGRGVICLKEKYHTAVERLGKTIAGDKNIGLHLMKNYYPAGDEQQIAYEVTGKVVPPGGLPISIGVIVCNVGTLMNIADAVEGFPVTDRHVTVTGAVDRPLTVKVPIGTPIRKLVEAAGGPVENSGYSVIIGGPAMGKVERDWSAVVTKTTGGVVVLPDSHKVIAIKTSDTDRDYRLAKSVCCQCNYCTLMCPRNSLGLGVAPHKVMRSIAYDHPSSLGDSNSVLSCCDCGICTLYACTMGLSPSTIVTALKHKLLTKGIKAGGKPDNVSESREYRKVPVDRFIQRLALDKYDTDAPLTDLELKVPSVKIPLKQHIGAPASPVASVGDYVLKGELIGIMEDGKLGANIHASVSGKVVQVSDQHIEIRIIG